MKGGEIKMGVITWLILGAVVGSLANFIDPRESRGGIIGSIVLGIVGALVGGFLASALGFGTVTGLNMPSVLIATVGALLLLFVGRAMRRA